MAYLLSPAGISTTPTISVAGFYYGSRGYMSSMKFSPEIKKMAAAIVGVDSITGIYTGIVELFDFDPFTGLISNQIVLKKGYMSARDSYGIEFSPAGTKLYVSRGSSANWIYQWDLCAGTDNQIIASCYTVANPTVFPGMLQLANDGHIYLANYLADHLSAIHNPDMPGAFCNYQQQSVFLGTGTSQLGLPNFVHVPSFRPAITTSINCQTVKFNLQMDSIAFSCSSPTLTYSWNFDDAASGIQNFSTQKEPIHYYSNSGQFNVKLIITAGCISDTLQTSFYINKCTGIDYKILEDEFSLVSENPNHGEIGIKKGRSCVATLYCFDGRMIWQEKLEADINTFSLTDIVDGVYLLKIVGIKSTRSYKIVIKK
jgi:hypothetical protein